MKAVGTTYRYVLVLRRTGSNAARWSGNSLDDLILDAQAAKRLYPSHTYWIYDLYDIKPNLHARVIRVI